MSCDSPVFIVYTPFFRGFYLGEISKTLFELGKAKCARFIHVRTGSTGEFDMPLAVNQVDGVISILNAISPKLIKDISSRGIPIVSIGHDYFPLPVEYIGGDSKAGINKVFDHLVNQGCQSIGFAADLSVSDMRVRFDAYKAAHKSNSLFYDSNRVFSVSNPDFQGGIETAELLVERNRNCDALIFAADKMAMGFASSCSKFGLRIPEDIKITGYDNSVLGEYFNPPLTSVDQNIIDLVELAFDRLCMRVDGSATFQEDIQRVEPRLVKRVSSIYVEKGSIVRKNYESKPPPSNEFKAHNLIGESSLAMAADGLASLQSFSNLYGPFMEWGALISLHEGKTVDEVSFATERLFNAGPDVNDYFSFNDATVEDFPLIGLKDNMHLGGVVNLLPVITKSGSTKVLMTKGRWDTIENASMLVEFGCFLELMTKTIEVDSVNAELQSRRSLESISNVDDGGFSWEWNLDSNQVAWGINILEMLGYNSEQEKDVFGRMGFFERVHPEDTKYLRGLIKEHLEKGGRFVCQFRLGSKTNGYIWVKAQGKAVTSESGKITRLVGRITEVPHQSFIKKKEDMYLAQHDQLTGLPSRGFLLNYLRQTIESHSSGVLGVLWLDLNRFKYVNDNYGHHVGDQLLRLVSKRLDSLLKKQHLLTRFGSDEFVVVCKLDDERAVYDTGVEILESLKRVFYVEQSELNISITGSMGYSVYPNTSSDPEELFQQAGMSAGEAKKQKLTEPLLYDSKSFTVLLNKITLEKGLRTALERGELFLLYQPQIDINTHEIIGVESLCRWNSPEMGIVPPDQFIRVAEETGIIHKLGDWIIDTSLMAMRLWQQAGLQHLKLSINVSANQLIDPGLLQRFKEKIDRYKLINPNIAIEVTETAAIEDLKKTCDLLEKFSSLGIQISLDDFGTGFSSLSLLKELPLQWVKIDKLFIDNIENDKIDQSIVESVCALSHSMDYKVIVEGVESEEQLQLAREMGCDVVQGYIYSKPMSATQIIAHYTQKDKQKKVS